MIYCIFSQKASTSKLFCSREVKRKSEIGKGVHKRGAVKGCSKGVHYLQDQDPIQPNSTFFAVIFIVSLQPSN